MGCRLQVQSAPAGRRRSATATSSAVLARLLGVVGDRRPAARHRLRRCVRLVRRTVAGVWQRTEGRPVRRALACLLAAALVAGLGWAWWPDGGHLPPGPRLGGRHGPRRRAGLEQLRRSAPGAQGAATTIWPADAGPLPTADHPVLAMVLMPPAAGGSGDGGRGRRRRRADLGLPVRPARCRPGDGDNQALAVNTEDGSVAYDVSFSLVWADGDDAR